LAEDRAGEDSWFQRNEKQLLDAARLAREKREAERVKAEKDEDSKRLRDLHFMKCPKDGHDMVEEDLGGVTIDRCSFCEGIFFDAGEMERLYPKPEEERRSLFKRLLKI
jgi:uncharacterized protein